MGVAVPGVGEVNIIADYLSFDEVHVVEVHVLRVV